MAVLRRQMKHVLFTEPAEIQAGQDVTIYYNPQDTPLSGCAEVYLSVSAPSRALSSLQFLKSRLFQLLCLAEEPIENCPAACLQQWVGRGSGLS